MRIASNKLVFIKYILNNNLYLEGLPFADEDSDSSAISWFCNEF